MKAKGKSIVNGVTRRWRSVIEDVETWIRNREAFLFRYNKFDTFEQTREGDTITIKAHRDKKGRCKEYEVFYILTIIEE